MKRWLAAPALMLTMGCGGGTEPEPVVLVDTDIHGAVTLDGVPVSSMGSLHLEFIGCEHGEMSCSDGEYRLRILDETMTLPDGSYHLTAAVPESICEWDESPLDRTRLIVRLWDDLLAQLRQLYYYLPAGGCGDRVLDIALVCDVVPPEHGDCGPLPAIRPEPE